MTTSFSAAAGLLPSSQLPLPRHLLPLQLPLQQLGHNHPVKYSMVL
jgi:hypothetical protein